MQISKKKGERKKKQEKHRSQQQNQIKTNETKLKRKKKKENVTQRKFVPAKSSCSRDTPAAPNSRRFVTAYLSQVPIILKKIFAFVGPPFSH